MLRRKTNRRHMTGDHHGRAAGRATLLVTQTDEILGSHRNRERGGGTRPGRGRPAGPVDLTRLRLGNHPASGDPKFRGGRTPSSRCSWEMARCWICRNDSTDGSEPKPSSAHSVAISA
jgi:hypothetical protein